MTRIRRWLWALTHPFARATQRGRTQYDPATDPDIQRLRRQRTGNILEDTVFGGGRRQRR